MFSEPGLWGRGNYFVVNASYSDSYAHSVHDTNMKKLLVAFVLTGLSYYCNQDRSLTMPPYRSEQDDPSGIRRRYHSVNRVTGGTTVYITYDNNQAYPAYVITYSRGETIRTNAIYCVLCLIVLQYIAILQYLIGFW